MVMGEQRSGSTLQFSPFSQPISKRSAKRGWWKSSWRDAVTNVTSFLEEKIRTSIEMLLQSQSPNQSPMRTCGTLHSGLMSTPTKWTDYTSWSCNSNFLCKVIFSFGESAWTRCKGNENTQRRFKWNQNINYFQFDNKNGGFWKADVTQC